MVKIGRDTYTHRQSAKDLIDEALELAGQIAELVEELPERAEEFGMSVAEQAAEIQKRVEETRGVTKAELEALRNMLAGIQNWINH